MTIKKCENCHKHFIVNNRSDTIYCDRVVDETGKTCKDVGAINKYKENIKDDVITIEYNKAYKRYYARIKYKGNLNITKEEFLNWANKAKLMKQKTENGILSPEEFIEWLNQ